ncbi:MAG: hypothetical protein QE271_00480 [Bacteriovoracaceae bacterium]|nr:hypothetical protein [Bacteriovoracaceae bacterium]
MGKIYFISGKGGVGKSFLADALELAFHSRNLKVKKILWPASETHPDYEKSTIEYIGLKLHSNLIAQWIYKTPFFKSLINMLPGLSYLVMLGKIIYDYKKNPETSVIIDGPSSGHFLSIIQAPTSFAKMFLSGPLFQDLMMMKETMEDKNKFSMLQVQLPTLLSQQESLETNLIIKENYNEMEIVNILNQSLMAAQISEEILQSSEYFHAKFQEETQINLSKGPSSYFISIPLSRSSDYNQKIRDVGPFLAPLFSL